MIHQLNKNNQIEVNGISAVLLDERAKEGIFVDTEDLTEPILQAKIFKDWEDINKNNERMDYGTPIRTAVRFKQPDRMELQNQVYNHIDKVWRNCTEFERLESWDTLEMDFRQIFILKEKEFEPKTMVESLKEYIASKPIDEIKAEFAEIQKEFAPLTKEYSMNEQTILRLQQGTPLSYTDREAILKMYNDSQNKSEAICPTCHMGKSFNMCSNSFHLVASDPATSPKIEDLPSVKPIPDVEGKPIKSSRLEERSKSISQEVKDRIDAYEFKSEGKTLQECKDIIAEKYGFISDTYHAMHCFGQADQAQEYCDRMDEAAELYASQSLNLWVRVDKESGFDLLTCFKMLSEVRLSSSQKQILEKLQENYRNRFTIAKQS